MIPDSVKDRSILVAKNGRVRAGWINWLQKVVAHPDRKLIHPNLVESRNHLLDEYGARLIKQEAASYIVFDSPEGYLSFKIKYYEYFRNKVTDSLQKA